MGDRHPWNSHHRGDGGISRPNYYCYPCYYRGSVGNDTVGTVVGGGARAASAARYKSTAAAISSIDADTDDDEDENAAVDEKNESSSSSSTTTKYSRKTPLEHVLLRPGMYVGPNERLPPTECWVPDPVPAPPPSPDLVERCLRRQNPGTADYDVYRSDQEESTTATTTTSYRIVKREYGLVPALIKVFDEILVNASDNRLRHPGTCTRIDVVIHPGGDGQPAFVQVHNDGMGIPVERHETERMYVPELLFGHLLTGSNFDDSEKRVTGGRHGYGAKLTNIFSDQFTVETYDSKRRRLFRQTWVDNMSSVTEDDPIAEGDYGPGDFTRVTFFPDLPRLTGDPGARTVSEQDYAVMCRRVLDVAGCTDGQLRVTLNGKDVSLPSFLDYCKLYRKSNNSKDDDAGHDIVSKKINSRWTVGVGLSESGSFENVSFVNGMSTSRGGTHVNAILQQIIKRLQDKILKIDPDLSAAASPGLIRRCLFVCCDALIENPSFDSQMKEYLTSSPKNFGSSCNLTKPFLDSLVRPEEEGGPGIVEEILRLARSRQQASLLREVGAKQGKRQLLSIAKLDDAHNAGTGDGYDCTLILTEGDSAKALAVAGLEVIGRERYGVFPLRGKFLNVRSASLTQLMNNGEATALCSILGLDFDKEYDTVDDRLSLRYGHVMLMTDQDTGKFPIRTFSVRPHL